MITHVFMNLWDWFEFFKCSDVYTSSKKLPKGHSLLAGMPRHEHLKYVDKPGSTCYFILLVPNSNCVCIITNLKQCLYLRFVYLLSDIIR